MRPLSECIFKGFVSAAGTKKTFSSGRQLTGGCFKDTFFIALTL
jgi:hypothetical protein